jgi:competence protein ComEA
MTGLFKKIGHGLGNGLGLTKKELTIIGFLAVSLIAGLVIKYSGWKNPQDHDYTESDKRFEAQVKSAFDDLDSSKLTDEQELKISGMKQFADSLRILKENTTQQAGNLKPGMKININTAYAMDLQLLPGIGEVMSERIIEYRERTGGFKSPEDLKKIKGIGEKKFEKIKDYVTVR